jgi:O-antigen/teichoic acid export membrane protein
LKKCREIVLRLMRIILWLTLLLLSGTLAFTGDFVRLWVTPRFLTGSAVTAFICVSCSVSLVVNIMSNVCFAMGDIKKNSVIGGIQAVLVLLSIVVGGKFWGLIGIVAAPVVMRVALSGWYFPMRFVRTLQLSRLDVVALVREAVKVVVIAGVLGAMGRLFRPSNLWELALEAGLCIVFYGASLALVSENFRDELGHGYRVILRRRLTDQ